MKTLLVIIDGLGDEKLPQLQGQTPYQAAQLPVLRTIAAKGTTGEVDICQQDFAADSLNCILRLLGLEKEDFPRSRAYLELLAAGEKLNKDETVWRCNLVRVDRHRKLTAFNGLGLSEAAMHDASLLIGQTQYKLNLVHLSGYRNLLVVRNEKTVDIKPPQDSLGENVDDLLKPIMDHCKTLKGFVKSSEDKLKYLQYEKKHYYLFYPWGPAHKEITESFALRQGGREGAVVAQAEIVRGIGKYLQMDVPALEGTTGDIDTKLEVKLQATLEQLAGHDFVVTHFNGCDEAAHRCDWAAKVAFLAKLDAEFFAGLVKQYHEPVKLLVIGDHITSSVSGQHQSGPVPYVAAVINGEQTIPPLHSYTDIWQFLYEGA